MTRTKTATRNKKLRRSNPAAFLGFFEGSLGSSGGRADDTLTRHTEVTHSCLAMTRPGNPRTTSASY